MDDPARRRLMPVLYAGVFLGALDTSLIGPAIPALKLAFGVDNREVGLVTLVFILCSLPATAVLAGLGDRWGRRAVFVASILTFALGSMLVAMASSFWVLLAGRALQGVGSGGIIPTASATIGDVLPRHEQGRALGLVGAVYGMAFVIGPPLAAVMLQVADWRWIFLINLPLALAVAYLGLRCVPARNSAHPLPQALDGAGIALLVGLLASLALGINRVADDWLGLQVWPWLLATVPLWLIALVRQERGAPHPLVPLQLFARRRLVLAYVLTAGGGLGMGGVAFLTSLTILAYGLTPAEAGLALLPLVLGSMAGSMGAGRALNRQGPRRLITLGFGLLALGYLGVLWTSGGWIGFVLASIPLGVGLGVIVGGALRSIAITEAPTCSRGAAQGLINIATAVGTLSSTAWIGTVADLGGRGLDGFLQAYGWLALVLGALVLLGLVLPPDRPSDTP
jgi:MFS family permease